MVPAAKGWHDDVNGTTNKKRKASPKKAPIKKAAPAKKAAPKKKAAPAKKAAPKKKSTPKKKPAKAEKADPVKTILAKLAEMDQIGITEVQELILLQATGYARSDSTGYRTATKTITKELGHAERKAGVWALTEEGRQHLLDTGAMVIPKEPMTNADLHAQLLEMLQKLVKAPEAKLQMVFELLQDGDWHETQEILEVAGYHRTDSTGYRSIMSGLKKLDLLEKEGKTVRLTDKAFLFGRDQKEK